jgi:predicted RNA-binding Zn-ribbon protein involved in translation (DUF1610 family)
MPRPDDEHSVRNEPHLRPGAGASDPSERRADHVLRSEHGKPDAPYRDGQSVFDEPDIYPGRPDEVIEQDWSCSRCGYNLRGLPTHHPCPECGHRELYRPAPAESLSYQTWIRRRIAATSPRRAWLVTFLVAVCGGPWAVLAAMIGTDPSLSALMGTGAVFLIVVFGPAVEETMKIAAAAMVVEVRPYLFKQPGQILFATVGAAAAFAAIENLLYLYVYFPNHGLMFALWRWTVCVALHVGCTVVASRGLVSVWQTAVREHRPPKLATGYRSLVTAIVIHASYNGFMVVVQPV